MMGFPSNRQSREPLTQFVCHGMQEFNSDTQSEDSMDAEVKKQTALEKQSKELLAEESPIVKTKERDDLTNKMKPI